MANIIRCVLPNGVHRFKPFTVSDYRDFLLVRNDMDQKDEDEQEQIVNELVADYFSEYPESWRPYMFLKLFTGSIGKTKIPIVFECPTCKKRHKVLFSLEQEALTPPSFKVGDTEVVFKIPDKTTTDLIELVQSNIDKVIHNGTTYAWEDLDEETQLDIVNSLDLETFEKIVKKLKPLFFSITLKCCGKHEIVYDNLLNIFKLLLNPDEIFVFYQINHILAKNNYSFETVSNMMPIERSIILSLIEKDNKK